MLEEKKTLAVGARCVLLDARGWRPHSCLEQFPIQDTQTLAIGFQRDGMQHSVESQIVQLATVSAPNRLHTAAGRDQLALAFGRKWRDVQFEPVSCVVVEGAPRAVRRELCLIYNACRCFANDDLGAGSLAQRLRQKFPTIEFV